MTGSTRVLVKVVLFQLRGRGHPQNDAMPNIFPDSKSLLLGLSNEVSFVSEIYWKVGWNCLNIFLKSYCMNIHVHQCMAREMCDIKAQTINFFTNKDRQNCEWTDRQKCWNTSKPCFSLVRLSLSKTFIVFVTAECNSTVAAAATA